MARLSSWMIVKGPYVAGSEAYVTLKVRTWHPGFWWFVVKAAWRKVTA